jgi:tRNA-2-methylthio-N6-dimethylallyladenosine synthase
MIKKLYIETHGCQMNVADSNTISDSLLQSFDIEETSNINEADILVMNTCSVREKPQEKVFSELGRWKKIKEKNPGAIIAVGGCVASQEGEAIIARAPFVDIVFGPQTLHRLPKLISSYCGSNQPIVDVSFPEHEKFDQAPDRQSRSPAAFVSIMEGCSKYCSFCIVPYTRGEEFSKDFKLVLKECVTLAKKGVREINFLGQNVNDYEGSYNGKTIRLADLIQYCASIEGIKRIRYTTSHPQAFTQDLIDAYQNIPELTSYLHLPVQSGSDRILSAMKRGYQVAQFEEQVAKLRAIRPNICVSTDLIIGFPGETEEDFQQTIELIKRVKFDHSFSFIYSKRPGTPAADIPDPVTLEEKKARLSQVQSLIQTQADEISQAMIGTVQYVLFENKSKKSQGDICGRTENCRYVNVPGDPSLIGQILPVQISSANRHFLRGTLIE